MHAISPQRYDAVTSNSGLKPKFIRELRPRLDIVSDWDDREYLPITDRSGNRGVLWVEVGQDVYIVQFELSRGIIDKASGRARSVICDLCLTQHSGTAAGRLSLGVPGKAGASRSLLCCADLACGQHVRGKTTASLKSKAQLRETISNDERVERLRARLRGLMLSMGVRPVSAL